VCRHSVVLLFFLSFLSLSFSEPTKETALSDACQTGLQQLQQNQTYLDAAQAYTQYVAECELKLLNTSEGKSIDGSCTANATDFKTYCKAFDGKFCTMQIISTNKTAFNYDVKMYMCVPKNCSDKADMKALANATHSLTIVQNDSKLVIAVSSTLRCGGLSLGIIVLIVVVVFVALLIAGVVLVVYIRRRRVVEYYQPISAEYKDSFQ